MEEALMRPDTQTHSTSNKTRWAGRILSGLVVLFLTWDGVIKVVTLAPVVKAFTRLGYPVLTHTFFPIYVGLLIWGGLLLRDDRLRAFMKQAFGAELAASPK
jgi:hypothetical protein